MDIGECFKPASAVGRRLLQVTGACVFLLASSIPAATANEAAVALVHRSPELAPLVECLNHRLRIKGSIVDAGRLVEGLEFRMFLWPASSGPRSVSVTALLKPDPSAFAHAHDGDAEGQQQAAERVMGLLRLHVGTRAWEWQPDRMSRICSEAATWIDGLRGAPILLDRVGPDGEPASKTRP